MVIELNEILHQRIIDNCVPLFKDGHYKHVALEAMTQVELTLKEKTGIKDIYGVTLAKNVFGPGKSIKLRVPYGEQMQGKAGALFEGAFSYYRNYAAHDGVNISRVNSLRIMILASELLELLGASSLSYEDVGGVEGLIRNGIISSREEFKELLKFLDNRSIVDDIVDGFEEALALCGYNDNHIKALLDIGVIEYKTAPYVPSELDKNDADIPENIGWFEITPLGRKILDSI